MSWYYYPPRETVAERKRKAQRTLKKLRKQHPDLQPVSIEGKGLAKTWWGKAWNANLERYADYSNRIDRGRSYVKNGLLLDLKIAKGQIDALVMGTEPRPYSVSIRIGKLTKQKWETIKQRSRDKIGSLQELLDGRFPRELEETFNAAGGGLFPSPAEIKLSCSCPDWADMCKHVAATLYGVGTRLDEKPEWFFLLRGVNVADIVGSAVNKRKRELLASASQKKNSSRIVTGSEAELSALFKINLADRETLPASMATSTKKAARKKKAGTRKTAEKKPAGKKPLKRKLPKPR